MVFVWIFLGVDVCDAENRSSSRLQFSRDRKFLDKIGPLRSINGYGLFVVTATVRNEIEVQGSNDGKAWKSYRFNYKPGR